MSFLNTMNINGSALTAQRVRMDVASENIANMDTTRTEGGGAYRRKTVAFEAIEEGDFASMLRRKMKIATGEGQGGVRVSQIATDPSDMKMVYNPSHPDANPQGYVEMPNVNLLQETVDAMAASRSYQANVTAINAVKAMATKALEVGR